MEWIVPKGGVEMKKSVVSLFLLVLIVIMNFVGCTESENFGDVKNRMTYYTSNDSDDFCDLIKIYNNYYLDNLISFLAFHRNCQNIYQFY